jgi:polysaccharide biosynthesis protein PelA
VRAVSTAQGEPWAFKAARPTRRAFLKAGAGLLSAAGSPNRAGAAPLRPLTLSIRWLVFYGERADEATLATYDIVVLDPGFQGSISAVADAGTRICSYLSLGEIKSSDPFFDSIDRAALLEENPDWPGTRRVDVRHPAWHSLVFDRQIPSIAAKGFNGLMLDTLDTAPYLEQVDPGRYDGMRAAAIGLVAAIRTRWPSMMLIMNRGYALLPDLVDKIDAVMAESLVTSPDPRTGGFVWVDPQRVGLELSLLSPAARRSPPLPILSLDYWFPDDSKTIAAIYRRERDLGHHPYVATRLLDRIVPEVH